MIRSERNFGSPDEVHVVGFEAVHVLGGLPRKPVPSIAGGFTSAGGMTGVKPLLIAMLIAKLTSANSSWAPTPVK